MMKHEFEALSGSEVTVEQFRMINELYMHYDELFPEKKDIAEFYKNNGFSWFERLYYVKLKEDSLARNVVCLFYENEKLKSIIRNLKHFISITDKVLKAITKKGG